MQQSAFVAILFESNSFVHVYIITHRLLRALRQGGPADEQPQPLPQRREGDLIGRQLRANRLARVLRL